MPEQRQSPATEPGKLSSEMNPGCSQTSEHTLQSQATSGERLLVQPIPEIQLPLQFATASCKHTDRGWQIQMRISWRIDTGDYPDS